MLYEIQQEFISYESDDETESNRGTRSSMLGYVEPAYHPAPFDTRHQVGAPPVYEKVVYQVNEKNVKKTFEKLRQSYELENLAASLTEPTLVTKTSKRRRWNQDPNGGNGNVFQSSIMFPPIMIKSESYSNDTPCSGGRQNQEFLEGLIAPPIIPVTRRHSCEIEKVFNPNSGPSNDMSRVRSNAIGRSTSSISSIIGDATTVRASSNSGISNERNDTKSSQANINRIRAFIEVN